MRFNAYVALGAAAGLAAALMLSSARSAQDVQTAYKQLDRFGDAFEKVRDNYVGEVGDADLIDGAIRGMVAHLDPHSNYMNAAQFEDMKQKTDGAYGGLGIEMTVQDGVVRVIAPIDDTPASRAGIKAGDLIVSVDGKSLVGDSLDKASDKMRGPSGTQTTLTIHRKGRDPFDVTLTRASIEPNKVHYRREGDIGYIRMTFFNERLAPGVENAVSELKKSGPIKGYVLDLRNNPGGLVNQAIAVADDFLDGGEIVTVRERYDQATERSDAKPGDIAEGKPIVVLINEGTASASEILSGALQDHKRATLIGVTSFGKGLVQTTFPLGAGEGALLLTTGRYYTPSGRSIQATGIEPDIAVAESAATGQNVRRYEHEADLPGHIESDLEGKHSVKTAPIVPEAGKKYADFQLAYALAYLDGKRLPGVKQGDTEVARRSDPDKVR